MFLRRRAMQSLDRWRRRMIRETEYALLDGLLHPNRNPRIPTIMVGVGQFNSRWAHRWWNSILELDDANCALDDEEVVSHDE